jgi:tripeptidyl-peptidase-1
MICHVSLVCCILLCFFGLERLQAYRFEELSHGVFQKKFDSIPGEKVFHSVLQETPNPKNLELYDRVGKPSSDDLHEGVFFVKQQNIDVLTERLYEVSNPLSPTYGDYLSLEEVKGMSINKNSINHILKVLQGYGFSEITTTVTGDFIIVEDKISLWESLLNCEFHVFRHKEIPNFDVIRTLEFSLPLELVNHVETVFNTVHFPLHKLPITSTSPELQTEINKLGDINPQVGRRVHGYVTPDLLFSFYHINPIGNSLASQGVYETIGQTYSPKDLELFQRKFNLTVSDIAVDIGGHKNDQTCIDSPDDCGEANLDVQYLMVI